MKSIYVILLFAFSLGQVSCPEWLSALQETASGAAQADVELKVTSLLDQILSRGEGQVGDVKTNTWVPPSKEDVATIRALGQKSIAPLNHALSSPVPFRQLIAVRLLEEVGGPDTLPVLKRGLEPDRWVVVRMQSLSSLRSVPDDLAIPILRNALHDTDIHVARRAHDLLVDYYHVKEE